MHAFFFYGISCISLFCLFSNSYSIFYWAAEHLCSYSDVFLLWPGSPGASHAEISVVEALPHLTTAGKYTTHIDILLIYSFNFSLSEPFVSQICTLL